MKITRQCMLTGMLVLMAALAMVAPAAADPYLGGDPLTNVQDGTVSGGLWFDAHPGFATSAQKTFTLPDHTNITWARLYIAVYLGNMKNNYRGNVTIDIDADGNSIYEIQKTETFDTPYSFPGEGGTGPVWLNAHLNRVTSDYLMWYDLTNEITGQTVNVQATTGKIDSSFDGRIKAMVLVVAYDDGDEDEVHYWVNQGHDTDSYVTDEAELPYIGETDFSTSDITATNANLTAIYLASYNGNYAFNGNALPWSNPQQGSYLGYQSWNVTDYITGGDSTMTFDRNSTDSGSYSGYFKIPLALLTVEEEE